MDKEEAFRILGVRPGTPRAEIKKRYRRLMQQVHPDASLDPSFYQYEAHEINAAYEVLKNEPEEGFVSPEPWDAPENADAYRPREILQYAENGDGEIFGRFSIAEGKYLWTPEEDFPLFLLSLYRLSKDLLDEIDEALQREEQVERIGIQGELTYLLAQQFLEPEKSFRELTKEVKEGIFKVPSMLELGTGVRGLAEGTTLYPGRLKQHRLFLKNDKGREVGYLSFEDDRLYYLILPMMEQGRALVKIKTAGVKADRRKYQKLMLWIKLGEPRAQVMKDLNLQIRELLERYRRM